MTKMKIDRWTRRIEAAWRGQVEGIFDTGRLLAEAKTDLEYGEWLAMVENALPFGARTAQCLMKIAADVRLSDATHASLLPPYWYTLYELTKLDDDVLEEKFADGTIHPEMKRGDILTDIKRERRAEREMKLAGRIRQETARLSAMPRYGVILADPPWRFEPWSRETGLSRAADNHYPTMTLEEIAALDVPAARDAALFLWAIVPMLPEALTVVDMWGFEYRSMLTWDKVHPGTGYWLRNQTEHLIIAIRGKIPAPAPGTAFRSLFREPAGEHSVKPEIIHHMIEELFPSLPKLELFATRTRPGWNSWGAELEAP